MRTDDVRVLSVDEYHPWMSLSVDVVCARVHY